ncbi:Nucleolar protein 16 [Aspergillus nanangensis]|uniref:Nucleolar protein 16 n=1 Tax=Aspergillus nanangensis TaxID=2582783 RepID=A0AAD4CF21_ASPNN|nr:Nucleolar protein 16 [Aspergillus nanangensis]
MGNIRQNKKNRSSLPKAKSKRKGMLKNGNKKINVLGNAIIAENWDRKLTLTQNYRRLGLVHRLNAPTGGSEKRAKDDGTVEGDPEDSLHIKGSVEASTKSIGLGEIKVERDPETGKILRVLGRDDEVEIGGRKRRRANPLNDPLNDLSDNEEGDLSTKKKNDSIIVQQLERQADMEGKEVKAKKPRHMSQREAEWIQTLIQRHGDNIGAMVRDRKLNPMQQTEGDLNRRIRKWKEAQA